MNLSKEELLGKARKEYTSGKKVKSAFDNTWTAIIPDNFQLHFYDDDGSVVIKDLITIYYNGQWAEILPEETTIEVNESEGIYRAFLTDPNAEFKAVYEKYLSEYNAVLDYALQEKHKEITRLTQEIKEAKEYREKVEAVIEKWSDEKINDMSKRTLSNGSDRSILINTGIFIRDQFKQIK